MSIEEEIKMWVWFWCVTGIIFVLIFCIITFCFKHDWIYKETKDVYRKSYKVCRKCGKCSFK